jgi:hypothetical protein
MDNSGGLPPANTTTLPGMDNGLPPVGGTAALPGMDATMSSAPGAGLPGMDNSGGLPSANTTTLPGMDNGLPPVGGTAALPGMDATMSSASGAGLPPIDIDNVASLPGSDNGGGLPPMANNSLPIVSGDNSFPAALPAPAETLPSVESTVTDGFPPTTMGSLPPTLDMNGGQIAPPDISAAVLPMLANVSSVPSQASPVSNNYHPSDLDIPAMPSKVNTGYLQDIPTLSFSKKPAA